jgi:hypothetical protein
LTLSLTSHDDTRASKSLEGIIGGKLASNFTKSHKDEEWKALHISDSTFLDILSTFRDHEWSILCNDILSTQPGYAMRTIFFERKSDTNRPSIVSPTSTKVSLTNTKYIQNTFKIR